MKKLIFMILLLISSISIFGADRATIGLSAYVPQDTRVMTKKISKDKILVSLDNLQDEHGQVTRTVISSDNMIIQKNKNKFALNLNKKEKKNEVVVLTVINS
ncbi:hypothetical protein SAMN02745174_01324 [Cetobacterium ceti]|uniref:Uncharacterized protein n=1 Tax=Cetobacterium ceti TaxID=180163 RepID=A0A1T4MTN7_9FUSO|nr:hypothetical protein [Cetobacterium ceti]SJZ70429.1 hypothetical protein SAMN02745174_01324 [Cetobacterium ceti]